MVPQQRTRESPRAEMWPSMAGQGHVKHLFHSSSEIAHKPAILAQKQGRVNVSSNENETMDTLDDSDNTIKKRGVHIHVETTTLLYQVISEKIKKARRDSKFQC